jgi:hypothetical protein
LFFHFKHTINGSYQTHGIGLNELVVGLYFLRIPYVNHLEKCFFFFLLHGFQDKFEIMREEKKFTTFAATGSLKFKNLLFILV